MALTKPQGDMVMKAAAAQAASGTAVTFSGIPAGTTAICIGLNNISMNGAGEVQIQIGDSGGLETSGYDNGSAAITSGAAVGAATSLGSGFTVRSAAAANVVSGQAWLVLTDPATNLWSYQGTYLEDTATGVLIMAGGIKALSGVLDRLAVNNVAGDTFDAGSISISYF